MLEMEEALEALEALNLKVKFPLRALHGCTQCWHGEEQLHAAIACHVFVGVAWILISSTAVWLKVYAYWV
jgi:hypothetical protein